MSVRVLEGLKNFAVNYFEAVKDVPILVFPVIWAAFVLYELIRALVG